MLCAPCCRISAFGESVSQACACELQWNPDRHELHMYSVMSQAANASANLHANVLVCAAGSAVRLPSRWGLIGGKLRMVINSPAVGGVGMLQPRYVQTRRACWS